MDLIIIENNSDKHGASKVKYHYYIRTGIVFKWNLLKYILLLLV